MSDNENPSSAVERVAGSAAAMLQRTRNDSSRTRGVLAVLRRSGADVPGADPALWELVVGSVERDPVLSQRADTRDRSEISIHLALCLYATHQQSRGEDMNVRGVSLGQAVARLESARPSSGNGISQVRRRFNAVATADGIKELGHHARGLVSQMRAAGIGLDYGLLARDLYLYQKPGAADSVRRRWGRDLYSKPSKPSTQAPSTPPLPKDNHDPVR